MGVAVLSLFALVVVAGAKPPRLAVVISVDQMRADYLERFRPYFGADGFNRLTTGGAYFTHNYYNHGVTITAPGHATLLSGVNANIHGIVQNEWRDPKTFIEGNSVEDVASPLVGLAPQGPVAAKSGRSPRNFLGTTVGDRLKEKYGAKAKVFGVADKDRASILMAGAKADGAYWGEEGIFVTSTYYRRELPAWVRAYNAAHPVEADYGKVWERLLDPAIYDRVQGPDDATGEFVGHGLTRTFPKHIDGGKPGLSSSFYWALDLAPWNNDLVEGLAERLIEVEQLGTDPTPDLLCVGFSQTDRIGHSYGPDSHEVMDSYLRLDLTLARFLSYLDRKIGPDGYVVVLTADHGVGPIPEQTVEKHGAGAGGRIRPSEFDAYLKQALETEWGALPEENYWLVRDGTGARINPAALAAKQLTSSRVQQAIRAAALKFPGVAEVWTRDELTSDQPLGGFGERIRLSYHVERSADVVFVFKPYWLLSAATNPAGHGSPYDYDSHVPQVWFGAGIKPGVRPERVAAEDLAPTLAQLLGVDLPAAKGRPLRP
jgi:predicted AlkP superfamily pyrophosphatase or phosphodiesterase